MGNYQESWKAIWTDKVGNEMAKLKKMEPLFKDNQSLMSLYAKVKSKYEKIEESISQHPDLDREEFERRYAQYLLFKKDFNRLTEAAEVIGQMNKGS